MAHQKKLNQGLENKIISLQQKLTGELLVLCKFASSETIVDGGVFNIFMQ